MASHNLDYLTIEPWHFFSDEKEKTKFNWFAFELACEIELAVPLATKKYLARQGYTTQRFNKSCINLAMLLQGIILKKLNGEIPEMEINYTEVEKAFPRLNDKNVNKLLGYTAKAWEHLLDVCVSCPSACLTNKDEYCVMFDDESYYSL